MSDNSLISRLDGSDGAEDEPGRKCSANRWITLLRSWWIYKFPGAYVSSITSYNRTFLKSPIIFWLIIQENIKMM